MNLLLSKGNLKAFDRQIYQTWGMLPEVEQSQNENLNEELVEKIQIAFTKGLSLNNLAKFEDTYGEEFRDDREKYNKERSMASTQYGHMDSDKIRSRASNIIEEDILEPAQNYMKRAREYGSNALERGTELVRENPGYTVLGAASVGFLLGAYFARRR